MKSCKTCQYLVVPVNALGRRVVRKDRGYECIVPIPMPPLPDSVTSSYVFKWPPVTKFMIGSDGTHCPAWQAVEKSPTES